MTPVMCCLNPSYKSNMNSCTPKVAGSFFYSGNLSKGQWNVRCSAAHLSGADNTMQYSYLFFRTKLKTVVTFFNLIDFLLTIPDMNLS